ncbi:hypothetical protein D3C73_1441480 [compost metagenome]
MGLLTNLPAKLIGRFDLGRIRHLYSVNLQDDGVQGRDNGRLTAGQRGRDEDLVILYDDHPVLVFIRVCSAKRLGVSIRRRRKGSAEGWHIVWEDRPGLFKSALQHGL